MELWHILNNRERADREWERFRQWDKWLNDWHQRNASDSRGRIRDFDTEECNAPLHNWVEEAPLDGKLTW